MSTGAVRDAAKDERPNAEVRQKMHVIVRLRLIWTLWQQGQVPNQASIPYRKQSNPPDYHLWVHVLLSRVACGVAAKVPANEYSKYLSYL